MGVEKQESKPENTDLKVLMALIRAIGWRVLFAASALFLFLLLLWLGVSPLVLMGVGTGIAMSVAFLLEVWRTVSRGEAKDLSDRVREAEHEAFSSVPTEIARQIREMERDQEKLRATTSGLAQQFAARIEYLQTGSLFNLYSKQIQQYQYQTRQRATYSFIFAILAMFVGLAFVALGAWHVLKQGVQPTDVAAGSAVSVVGGAIGAYITKTFLEVHKISLAQLNRYFQQPVINETILTAQRLSDLLPDPQHRSKAYQHLIQKVVALIGSEGTLPSHGGEHGLADNSASPLRFRKARLGQQGAKPVAEDATGEPRAVAQQDD